MRIVFALLGASQSNICCYLLLVRVWQPPLHPAVCCESARELFCGCHILLCSSDCANIAVRYSRLCRAIHYRDCQVLAALCSPDYLEYESQCLQGRGFTNCMFSAKCLPNVYLQYVSRIPSNQHWIKSWTA
jgi:hypothetical protein